ncbi:MAG: GNAT family N-acetyltransferase [Clostridiaceae bacterium]|jgi:ribosomal protein S18 acetylase RimI-like enzyme|nr:GNAT family N-acetyltransferase [Clostridiaceae bacterium]
MVVPELHVAQSEADARQLAELAREIWTEHYTGLIGAGQVSYMLERYQSAERIWQDIRKGGVTYAWLTCGPHMAAYMAYSDKTDYGDCFLSKLYVKKDYRGQGLAKTLLGHLVTRCRRDKKRSIWLTVNKHNSGSIAAYKKLGFSCIDSVVTDIGNGFVMDDYVLRREI